MFLRASVKLVTYYVLIFNTAQTFLFQAKNWTLHKDGLAYFTPDSCEQTFDNAKLRCEQEPGFRMAQIKTVAALEIAASYEPFPARKGCGK